MGAARADGTARESGFHCMSPVVASRLFAPIALATPPLTRRPAPEVLPVGITRGNCIAENCHVGMVTICCR
jgi:hypothetical protein